MQSLREAVLLSRYFFSFSSSIISPIQESHEWLSGCLICPELAKVTSLTQKIGFYSATHKIFRRLGLGMGLVWLHTFYPVCPVTNLDHTQTSGCLCSPSQWVVMAGRAAIIVATLLLCFQSTGGQFPQAGTQYSDRQIICLFVLHCW